MRKKILIVHQDDSQREKMHGILSQFDFSLAYADNGSQALQYALVSKPNLIITQTELPQLSGLELCSSLNVDSATKNIPIIFLHDRLEVSIMSKARILNAEAFLIKPYIDNSLIYAIKRGLKVAHLATTEHKPSQNYEECRLSPFNDRYYSYL